LNLLV